MMKTLYLYNTKEYNLKPDGPSLIISKSGKSGFRVPYPSLDFIFINYENHIPFDIFKEFARFKKPIVLTHPQTEYYLHIIPVFDSGYFEQIPQRIAFKNPELRKKLHIILSQINNEIQIYALKVLDRNLGLAYKRNSLTYDQYRYHILKHTGKNKSKFYIVKRHIRLLLTGLINSKCLEHNLDVNISIIDEKKHLGFTHDICKTIDPISDILSLKFLDYNQKKLWTNKEKISKSGFKLLSIIFEKSKPTISNLLDRILRKIKKIIEQ